MAIETLRQLRPNTRHDRPRIRLPLPHALTDPALRTDRSADRRLRVLGGDHLEPPRQLEPGDLGILTKQEIRGAIAIGELLRATLELLDRGLRIEAPIRIAIDRDFRHAIDPQFALRLRRQI